MTNDESQTPEAPPVRARTILHLHLDDGSFVAVDHVYEPEGSATCSEDGCGAPAHDPGMVGLLLSDDDTTASALMSAGDALILAERLQRAASLVMESMEDTPDLEREAARYGSPAQEAVTPGEPKRELTETERKVWAAWHEVADDEESPAKRIARDLGMAPADVAFIVFPAETFGAWADDQEPDV